MNRGSFPMQCRWLIPLVLGTSLIWGGCNLKQPFEVQGTFSLRDAEVKHIDTIQDTLYSVDLIEADIAVLLSRCQPGEMITVPYHVVDFAQEGDILRATGDPYRPYELDQETTRRVRRNVASLLERLTG